VKRTELSARQPRRLSPLERIGRGVERMLRPGSEEPSSSPRRSWLPSIRVREKSGVIVIKLESPEIDPKRILIRLVRNVLTLSGASVSTSGEPGYHSFKRSIVLPGRIDPKRISARCTDRTLSIRIRKAAEPGTGRAARDVMIKGVMFVAPETSIRDTADLLREKNIGSVPVCRDGAVVGILTDRDIAIRATAAGLDPIHTPVAEIMTRNVVTCREDDRLADVEQLMHDRQIRRVPVVDRVGSLVGYMTLARIARHESERRSGHVLRGISQKGESR
jgi:CBS domain-containing protein